MQTPQQTVDKAKSEKKDNEDSKKDDVNSHTPF